jgi:ketosteroid isomerase-like protein
MSSPNLERLHVIYEGWQRGDFTVSMPFFDRHAILVLDPELPDAGVHVGLDGIRAYMTNFLEAWRTLTITARSFTEAGDTVLVAITQAGVGQDSGVTVAHDYFQLWTFRAGKVVRLESVNDEATALAAIAS